MDFQPTEDQVQLRESARAFAQGEMREIAREMEQKDFPLPHEWVRRYGEMGFLGVNVAPEYGGLGLGNLEALIVIEEFAKISPAVAFPIFESSVGPVRAIEHFANEKLVKRVLPAVCRGDMVIAIAMSEPDAGTGVTDLTTTGRIEGDSVVLNGVKRWSSGGGHADAYVVYTRLSDKPGAGGIGAVLVEKDAPGVSFGPRTELMGFRGISTADIFLDDATVPAENVIVPAGGFKNLMEAFDLERCGNATMCLAIAQAALDDALAYVQERKQFGRELIEFQAVQLKLAEMAMKVEAARLLIYRAAQNSADGLPSILDSSVAKCFANEIVRDVTGAALQVMGAYGYSKEFPQEQRLRDAWGWGIAGGAIDIQKVNIASALVGRRFSQRA